MKPEDAITVKTLLMMRDNIARNMAEPRQQPTAIHVNETRRCNYS